ncbi:15781_t:CDS:2, partial [Gigaspora rosea]
PWNYSFKEVGADTTIRTITRALMTDNMCGSPIKNRIQQLQIAAATNKSILAETHGLKKSEDFENPMLVLKKPNPFTFNKITPELKAKWILTKKEEWGKISSKKGHMMIATHWIRYNKNLRRCEGCEMNCKSLKRKKCTIEVNMEDAYIVQVDTKRRIHMRIEDITENERMALTSIGPSRTRDIREPENITSICRNKKEVVEKVDR